MKTVSRKLNCSTKTRKMYLEDNMLHLNKLFRTLWKTTIQGDLNRKDKAEILRLLIFAFVVISQLVIFVWLTGIVLDHL